MRINRYVASATGMSRRAADRAISDGRVYINGRPADIAVNVASQDSVKLDDQDIKLPEKHTSIILHKPVGYVCSRQGQGSRTIYDLLPDDLHNLKPVGRLDKDSSGLLLMTDDGKLAHELTHPRFNKIKRYLVTLDKDLAKEDFGNITQRGVRLEDGLSRFSLDFINDRGTECKIEMAEGRNRQIRRTFAALGYKVVNLHRTGFGNYTLPDNLSPGKYESIKQ